MQLAKDATLYGVVFEDMSRDELIAAAAMGWKAYSDGLKKSIDSMGMLNECMAIKQRIAAIPST